MTGNSCITLQRQKIQVYHVEITRLCWTSLIPCLFLELSVNITIILKLSLSIVLSQDKRLSECFTACVNLPPEAPTQPRPPAHFSAVIANVLFPSLFTVT